MNDNDFYAALGASIDGRGNVANSASMYGAREYQTQRGSEQVRESLAASCGGTSRAAGPGILDDAAEFAADWTDNIIDFVSSGFTWVPGWAGLVSKAIGVFVFLVGGVHLGCTGVGLLVMAAIGWFTPLIVNVACRLTIGLTLMTLYLCLMILTAVLMVGIAFGVLGLLAAVLGV